ILVRNLKNGDYEIISGGHRLRDVEKLGRGEIESKILDVKDSMAAILSIKIRAPYIEGFLFHKCFKRWYDWHFESNSFNLDEFITFSKKNGRFLKKEEERIES
ncbi:MAG: hypothetical protein ACTSYC_05015, partial [Promethearchaeota archaeon]